MKAIYPGTFDPITNGHIDIIERAHRRFQTVVVAVSQNPGKMPLFTLEERIGMVKSRDVGILVKGLRAVTDFDYELQMAQMNHKLAEVETLFMVATPSHSFLSSSLVKEIARFGGDVSAFVPAEVARKMKERFRGEA